MTKILTQFKNNTLYNLTTIENIAVSIKQLTELIDDPNDLDKNYINSKLQVFQLKSELRIIVSNIETIKRKGYELKELNEKSINELCKARSETGKQNEVIENKVSLLNDSLVNLESIISLMDLLIKTYQRIYKVVFVEKQDNQLSIVSAYKFLNGISRQMDTIQDLTDDVLEVVLEVTKEDD